MMRNIHKKFSMMRSEIQHFPGIWKALGLIPRGTYTERNWYKKCNASNLKVEENVVVFPEMLFKYKDFQFSIT